jgi:hypothetical protein
MARGAEKAQHAVTIIITAQAISGAAWAACRRSIYYLRTRRASQTRSEEFRPKTWTVLIQTLAEFLNPPGLPDAPYFWVNS